MSYVIVQIPIAWRLHVILNLIHWILVVCLSICLLGVTHVPKWKT